MRRKGKDIYNTKSKPSRRLCVSKAASRFLVACVASRPLRVGGGLEFAVFRPPAATRPHPLSFVSSRVPIQPNLSRSSNPGPRLNADASWGSHQSPVAGFSPRRYSQFHATTREPSPLLRGQRRQDTAFLISRAHFKPTAPDPDDPYRLVLRVGFDPCHWSRKSIMVNRKLM